MHSIKLLNRKPGFSAIKIVVSIGLLIVPCIIACRATPSPQWNWERVEDGLPRQAIVLSVAVDPLESGRLWAGFYASGGLATSNDGGQSWATDVEGLADNPVFDLLVTEIGHGAADNIRVWAATRDGLFWSDDAGNSWEQVKTGLPAVPVLSLAADSAGHLYIGLDSSGIYTGPITGHEWRWLTPPVTISGKESSPISSPVTSASILSLAVSADGQQLYAGSSGQGVFASDDGGETWVTTYPGEYASNIAFNPINSNIAVASLRDRLVRTLDGGQSWHTLPLPWARDQVVSLLWLAEGTLGAGTAEGQLFRSDDSGNTWVGAQTGLAVSGGGVMDLSLVSAESANDQPHLLAGTWTGVYRSNDGGQSWVDLIPSIGVPHAETLLSTGIDLFLGTRSGLFRWQPDRRSWSSTSEGLPDGVLSLAVDPMNHQLLYAGTSGDGVYVSNDGGTSWQALPTLKKGIPAIIVDPQETKNIYMLAAWERVYESHNGGSKWGANWDGLGEVIETTSLAVDPVKPVVYVGTETGLYRRYNDEDWQLVAATLVDQSILALLAQPRQTFFRTDTIVYLGTTRGIYYSTDDGDTVQGGGGDSGWGRGLENISVTSLVVDPVNPRLLYAGTAYAGVYQSVDSGQTWQPTGPAALEDSVVEALAWGPEGELFLVSTSGVWRGLRQ